MTPTLAPSPPAELRTPADVQESSGVSGPGRKALITRDDIVQAALKLVGPHRSVSSLSLREVAREAGIAPNSFYRQFRDMDELAVALIELAGLSLRSIIGEARRRANGGTSVVRSAVMAFMDQLGSNDVLLHILLCAPHAATSVEQLLVGGAGTHTVTLPVDHSQRTPEG